MKSLIALAALLIPCSLAAQINDTILGTKLVSSHAFRSPFHDTLTLDVHKHGRYRIAVWPAGADVQIASLKHPDIRTFAPVVRQASASKPAIVELYPQDDGAHILSVTAPASLSVVNVWVWEDSAAEAATAYRKEHRLHGALVLGAGLVSGYTLPFFPNSLTPTTDSSVGSTSSYLEGGVLAASHGPIALFLGFGHDPRNTPEGITTSWLIFEARSRLVQGELLGHALEVGGAVRFAKGYTSQTTTDPESIGGGMTLNWHLDKQTGYHGLSLTVEALYNGIMMPGALMKPFARGAISLTLFP